MLLLAFLVLLSAGIGATSGLLLVYTVDLPQVDELERYRPSSVTELYDDQGRVIGSFALQRRVVASYDDYPQVLRDARRAFLDVLDGRTLADFLPRAPELIRLWQQPRH